MFGENRDICILEIVKKYTSKHPSMYEVGGEYVYQDDRAQEDAVEMMADIADILKTPDDEL